MRYNTKAFFLNQYSSFKSLKNGVKIFKSLIFYILFFILLFYTTSLAQNSSSYVVVEKSNNTFTLSAKGSSAPIYVCSKDYSGVHKILNLFQKDISAVTDAQPEISFNKIPSAKEIIIIGTIGKSTIIDSLVAKNKLDASSIKGKWETFLILTIDKPYPNVDKALVIVGSDKRGTIFGMFDVSREIGVSPWYWWADAPIQKKKEIFIKSGIYSKGTPKVKYRGIFINDEGPALEGWIYENFGDKFNHKFYEKVYELILRLHGNYLWPAMWGKAIYDDDSLSAPMANELGVVIGTSHHEPLMRAHIEWSRYGKGDWNYEKNPLELQKFWREGIKRMGNNESIVTIGMRGDGDEAMTEGTAIELMEKIVKDQRKIIEEVTGKPAEETPQAWALYKEVQDYYDKGMRVPDDVMLLLCDDNWGNIRVLPKKEDLGRKGGFGIYYHYDFVGGPVSYRWLNVTQIEKVWEQMNLVYQWGARELWLVNVGDIKPMELPISFFTDFAWDPEKFTADKLPAYYTFWAKQQFGEKYAAEIGRILSMYTKYNARRTPEMLRPDLYSLVNYSEAENVVRDYKALVKKSKAIYNNLSEDMKAAFYQLVMFPVEICANLNEMYVAAAKNKRYGEQGRTSANYYANKVRELFDKDAELTHYYHTKMANGKWNHIMSQTHIGYTNWNNPPVNKMPAVSYVNIEKENGMGIELEQSGQRSRTLPQFDNINKQQYTIEIFNTGKKELSYSLKAENDWIELSSINGSTESEEKVLVSINWNKAPAGMANSKILVTGAGNQQEVNVKIRNNLNDVNGFVENNGVVSIEAANYSRTVSIDNINWLTVPNLGRTNSAVTISPANAHVQTPGDKSPHLQYDFTVFKDGEVDVQVYLSPTLNFKKEDGLKYAVSIDDEKPQIINMHESETRPDWTYPQWWNQSVTDHIKIKSSKHTLKTVGNHTLKIWMIDPGIVFQKIVIDAGGLKPSYLGPPESLNIK